MFSPVLPSSLQEPPREEGSQEVPVEPSQIGATAEDREEAVLPVSADVAVDSGTSQSSSLPSQVSFETRGPNMDGSVDMLMEDKVKSDSGPQGHHRPGPFQSVGHHSNTTKVLSRFLTQMVTANDLLPPKRI